MLLEHADGLGLAAYFSGHSSQPRDVFLQYAYVILNRKNEFRGKNGDRRHTFSHRQSLADVSSELLGARIVLARGEVAANRIRGSVN